MTFSLRPLTWADLRRANPIDVSERGDIVLAWVDGALIAEPHEWERPQWDPHLWEQRLAGWWLMLKPDAMVGAFAGYCYTETSFSGLEGSMTAFFSSSAEPYTEIHRPTTTALPDLPVKASGFYWGLRVSFRI